MTLGSWPCLQPGRGGAHHKEDGPQEHDRVEGHEGPHPAVRLPATALHALALLVDALVAAQPLRCTPPRASGRRIQQIVLHRCVAHCIPGLVCEQAARCWLCSGSGVQRTCVLHVAGWQVRHARCHATGHGCVQAHSQLTAGERLEAAGGVRFGTSWPLVSARPEKPVMGSTMPAMTTLARMVKNTSPGFSFSPCADTPRRRAHSGMKSRLQQGQGQRQASIQGSCLIGAATRGRLTRGRRQGLQCLPCPASSRLARCCPVPAGPDLLRRELQPAPCAPVNNSLHTSLQMQSCRSGRHNEMQMQQAGLWNRSNLCAWYGICA